MICSDIIRAARERPDYSPLAALRVTPGQVTAAVAQIAATGSSFRGHVSVWLDDVENVVLQHIAREQPRSPRRIRRALAGTAEPDQLAKALDGLELMSLVEHRRGRHRVRVPVFERWINMHLDQPEVREHAVRQRRISLIAIGFTCTALLFGGYWTWLRSTRSAQVEVVGDCSYQIDYPDRIGIDEQLELFVYQDCAAATPHQVAIEAVRSSLRDLAIQSSCAAAATACTLTATATAGKQASDVYRVRLRVDGRELATALISKDRFATIRSIGERSVPAISFIPLLLTLISGFHKDIRRFIAGLFGRRADPPPSDPPAPTA
jgi:hypothetical protein